VNRRDFASGLFWLGTSLFFMTRGLELEVGRFISPKPGFLLFWSSGVFAFLSVVLVVRSVAVRGAGTRLADSWRDCTWWNPAITVALLCLYASFLRPLGFLPAMSLLMAILYALGRVRWHVSLAGAVVTVLLAYAVFHLGLQVPLPGGILDR
jgi:hypothetical protein